MRHNVLKQVHDSHQGMVCKKDRARHVVYGPGLENDKQRHFVMQYMPRCLASNHRQPISHKPHPGKPFQMIAADFCSYASREYLIMVDATQTGRTTYLWATTLPQKPNVSPQGIVLQNRHT